MNATAVPHGTDARATSGGTDPSMIPEVAYVHGALMVFVDALQTGMTIMMTLTWRKSGLNRP